jgi:EpsI family protein
MRVRKEFLLALLLLVGAGVLLQAISHGEAVPIRKRFAEFPLHIGEWSGQAHELTAKVLEVLQVDDYMTRYYHDGQGHPLDLYVGYYRSQRQGATYHSPKNCLPGSGWGFVDTGTVQLHAVDSSGQTVEVNRVLIQKGVSKQLVLYWYQDRGRIITSEYWAKAYMILDALFRNRTDGALVRIIVPVVDNDEAGAFRRGKRFAEAILPLLSTYLPG